jgi:hypothetical protein
MDFGCAKKAAKAELEATIRHKLNWSAHKSKSQKTFRFSLPALGDGKKVFENLCMWSNKRNRKEKKKFHGERRVFGEFPPASSSATADLCILANARSGLEISVLALISSLGCHKNYDTHNGGRESGDFIFRCRQSNEVKSGAKALSVLHAIIKWMEVCPGLAQPPLENA